MKKVIAIKGHSKKEVEEALRKVEAVDARVELIQALIPLGLSAVQELLQEEVIRLAGERYGRERPFAGHVRWGCQESSIYLADQKISLKVPRVRDMVAGREVALRSLEKLQAPRSMDVGLFSRVLKGLSCRDYRECAEAVPEAFGLSASTVSRRFIRASARRLKVLMERGLEGYDFVAIVLDGKRFAEDEMVIAVGITVGGEKVVLGFVQTATENEKSCSEFLRELVGRGLRYDLGLLVVVDGSKGFRKAVEKVFGKKAMIQRCQWHKRENVISYLSEKDRELFSKKLQAAYEKPTYEEAKASLLRVKQELKAVNLSAVASLEEGFEETLTLHRLGVFAELGTSLKTTNLIESLNSRLGEKTDKVDRWRNSEQKQRWVASALLEIEKGFRRLMGYRHLPRLREALKTIVTETENQKLKTAA